MHELRLTYEADLPARSGLGTSSSFAVGMLNAFYALKGKYADKRRLADEAIYLERTLCKESGAVQDQIAASFCGLNRSISDRISSNSIDSFYAKGIAAGALGGKLLGAGGGGFLLFYVEEEKREAVHKAMEELLYVPFQFESSGTRVLHFSPEEYRETTGRQGRGRQETGRA